MSPSRAGRSPRRRIDARIIHRRALAPAAERLEDRRLLSLRTWTNPLGGDFTQPSNWANSIVPGAADTAVFNLASSGTTVINGVNPTNGSLSVADPSLSYVATASFFLNDPNNPSVANATTYTLTNLANIGVNGSGSLEIKAGNLAVNGSATIGLMGNGFLKVDPSYKDTKTGNLVPAGSLTVNGGLQVGDYRSNSFGQITGGVTAGSAIVDHGVINGGLFSNGTVLLANDSQVSGGVGAGALTIGKSSSGLKASVSGSMSANTVVMSAPGFTDTASLDIPPDNAGDTVGSFIAAASRTTGVDEINVHGALMHPAEWSVGGPLTLGQFGGQAHLNLANQYVIASSGDDVVVGSGTDSATGTPSKGTLDVNTGFPIAGNLILAPNGGLATVNINTYDVSVGKVVSLSKGASVTLQNAILSASSINNGGGSIAGYGVLVVQTPLGSNNFAINNPTGAVVDKAIAVGGSNAYIYSNQFPKVTFSIDGGTIQAINGTRSGFYAVVPSTANQPGEYTVISGNGSILSPVTVLEGDANRIAVVDPDGVLNIANFAFNDSSTKLKLTIGGNNPGPQGSGGYDQLNLTGQIFLQGAVLDAQLTNGFVPQPGQRFTIVNNDDIDPINGVFDLKQPDPKNPGQFVYTPLTEGSVFPINGMDFTITYKGGDGNDVQLIANRPPTAVAGGPYSVAEGGTVTLSAAKSSDPEQAANTLTYLWDLNGDGIFGQTGDLATHGDEVGQTVNYRAGSLDGPSDVTVALKVVDRDGLVSKTTATIHIDNAPPTATFSAADSSVVEGGTTTVRFTGATDPSSADAAAGYTFSFDINGDGSFDLVGPVPSATVPASTFADGPGSVVVHGRITDKDGGFTDYAATIQITNAPPTANLSAPTTLIEGQPLTIALTSPTDPSPIDRAAGFTYAFDLGDGAGYGKFGSSSTATAPASKPGTRTVRAKIRDKDGGVTEYTQDVAVKNVAPTITLPVTSVTIDRGQTLDVSGSFTDPGVESWQVLARYQDGTAFQALTILPGKTFRLTHRYDIPGHYTATVVVNDGTAGDEKTIDVTVRVVPTPPGDLDGDKKTDPAVFRPSTAQWLWTNSTGGSHVFSFGAPGDVPVSADFDGDGKADLALFRPSTAQWFILRSSLGGEAITFGASNLDIPVVADYDGDGKADLAVFRPTTAQWFILYSSGGGEAISFGSPRGDQPIPADYDGDGKADLAVFRPSTAQWFILRSSLGGEAVTFGARNLDQPIPADYDGDGKADIAVYRPTTSQWFILQSKAGPRAFAFGTPNLDMPLVVDFDGDGKADVAVYRPTTAQWFAWPSGGGFLATAVPGSTPGDVPIWAAPSYRYTGGLKISRLGWALGEG